MGSPCGAGAPDGLRAGLFHQRHGAGRCTFVAPFSYATLVFAALYDFLGFGVVPDAVSLLGAVIILAGAAVLAWREGRMRPPAGRAATAGK